MVFNKKNNLSLLLLMLCVRQNSRFFTSGHYQKSSYNTGRFRAKQQKDQSKKTYLSQHSNISIKDRWMRNRWFVYSNNSYNKRKKYMPPWKRRLKRLTYSQRKAIYRKRRLTRINSLKNLMFFEKFPDLALYFFNKNRPKINLEDERFIKFYSKKFPKWVSNNIKHKPKRKRGVR